MGKVCGLRLVGSLHYGPFLSRDKALFLGMLGAAPPDRETSEATDLTLPSQLRGYRLNLNKDSVSEECEGVSEELRNRSRGTQAMPPKCNYAGQQFGRITLESPIPGRPGYWRARCQCGNGVEKRLDNLKRPGDHSCGHCGTRTSPLTDADIRASLAALEARIAQLSRDLTALQEQGRRTRELRPLHRDGATVKVLQGNAPQMKRLGDDMRQPPGLADATSPDELQVINAEDGDLPASQSRWKYYPLARSHPLCRRFYCWETPDGHEVETDLGGTREFLGFFDTLAEVQQAIKVYLDENNYTPEDDLQFFAQASG